MAALILSVNVLHKAEMENRGRIGHIIGGKQYIALISRIDICYATCHILTQNLAPTLPGFQGIKRCVQYLDSHKHKPIFYPSNSYDGSNVIRLIWSGNQVEDYTTQIFLEFHQDAYHARIPNIRF